MTQPKTAQEMAWGIAERQFARFGTLAEGFQDWLASDISQVLRSRDTEFTALSTQAQADDAGREILAANTGKAGGDVKGTGC